MQRGQHAEGTFKLQIDVDFAAVCHYRPDCHVLDASMLTVKTLSVINNNAITTKWARGIYDDYGDS